MISQHQILQVPKNNNTSPSSYQRRRRICCSSICHILLPSMMMLLLLQTSSAVSARRWFSTRTATTTTAATAAFISSTKTTTRQTSTTNPSSIITNNNNLLFLHQYSDHQRHQISLYSSSSSSSSYNNNDEILLEESGYHRPPVQWYPGHIAKAERQLSETLKAVDVVVEVRDARACKATAHPRVGEWCAGRPRIVVLTHLDMTPKSAVKAWQRAYKALGAERWDDTPLNTQVANQANQARQVRFQYDSNVNNKNKKSNKKQQQHYESQQQQSQQKPVVVTPVEQVLFVNARQGEGIHMLTRSIFRAGSHVQERRERRGLNPRPLRVGIIGYPNVGKSALINRLLGRRRARTANTPGVTRSLQWIRVRSSDAEGKSSGRTSSDTYKKEFELLDSPGIIPAKMVDQSDALLLAACNCIGQAAYDNQAVAAYLCEWLKALHIMGKSQINAPQWQSKCIERYGFDPLSTTTTESDEDDEEEMTGEDILFKVADLTCQGNPEDAARKILQDFRTGRMGPISLQVAPETSDDDGQMEVPLYYGNNRSREASAFASKQRNDELLREQQDRARIAMETAKERGLELPPMVVEKQQQQQQETDDEKVAAVQEMNKKNDENNNDDDIGKGMFDGW